MNRNPSPLSPTEWDEVAALEVVHESWGLGSGDAGEALSEVAYGAKFHFFSGSPGYVGDLFIIHGDTLAAPPFILIRNAENRLELA